MQKTLNVEANSFNLDATLNCGQVFTWKKNGDYYYGVVGKTVIKLRQDQDKIIFQTFPKEKRLDFIQNYFRLDDDLPKIFSKISADITIQRAIDALYGLRIIRQDPWECLISYICATFTNIARIKGMVRNLSQKFGKKISYDGLVFYTFPLREDLAKATLGELLDCGLGFRSKYVHSAAKIMNDNFDLKSLKRLSYAKATRQLRTLPGVGPKVADCVLLFSLEKLEAFPIDVWIERILCKHYSQYLSDDLLKKNGLTIRRYEQISTFGREYFGEYAGYAQEYLFHYYRLHSYKRWR